MNKKAVLHSSDHPNQYALWNQPNLWRPFRREFAIEGSLVGIY